MRPRYLHYRASPGQTRAGLGRPLLPNTARAWRASTLGALVSTPQPSTNPNPNPNPNCVNSTGEALRHAEAAESVAVARRHAALPVAHHEAEAARLVHTAARRDCERLWGRLAALTIFARRLRLALPESSGAVPERLRQPCTLRTPSFLPPPSLYSLSLTLTLSRLLRRLRCCGRCCGGHGRRQQRRRRRRRRSGRAWTQRAACCGTSVLTCRSSGRCVG